MNKMWTLVLTTLCLSMAADAVADDRLGAMGDSLTDEYFEQAYGYARNWAQLLVDVREIDMGPTAAEAGQPDGTWGVPRRTRYEHNWAQWGARTDALIAAGQHTGLRESVESGGVTRAVLFIGANDFGPWGGCYASVYGGFWTAEDIDAWISSRMANMVEILDIVQSPEVTIVVANIPDIGLSPTVQGLYPDPVLRDLMTAVVQQANGELMALAEARGLTVVDIFALSRAIYGTNLEPRTVLYVGDVAIKVQQRDTDGSSPNRGFVADGIHPHTVTQGIWTNALVTALNQASQAGIARFSEAELLENAGLAYGGRDTLAEQIGTPADYVITPCASDLSRDGTVAVADLLVVLGAWSTPDGDVTGDGTTDVADLLAVLSAWGHCD